jgi:hypothetical protein
VGGVGVPPAPLLLHVSLNSGFRMLPRRRFLGLAFAFNQSPASSTARPRNGVTLFLLFLEP